MNDYGVLRALYQILSKDSELMKSLRGVYTHVPDQQEAPYILLVMPEVVGSVLKGPKVKVCLKVEVHFISKETSVAELHRIMGYLSRLLDLLELSVEWNHLEGKGFLKEMDQSQAFLKERSFYRGLLTYHCLVNF